MKIMHSEEKKHVQLNDASISPFLAHHSAKTTKSDYSSGKKTLDSNMDEFIRSLQALSNEATNEGQVRRASLRGSANPFDFSLGLIPENLEKQIQQKHVSTPNNSPLKRKRSFSDEKQSLLVNNVHACNIDNENQNNSFSLKVQQVRIHNHLAQDKEKYNYTRTSSCQPRKKLVLPKGIIQFSKDGAGPQRQKVSEPKYYTKRNETSSTSQQSQNTKSSHCIGKRYQYLPLTHDPNHHEIAMPKIVKATENIRDFDNILHEANPQLFKKSKSLNKIVGQKQEINHRLIPTDFMLDAKANVLYNMEHHEEIDAYNARILAQKQEKEIKVSSPLQKNKSEKSVSSSQLKYFKIMEGSDTLSRIQVLKQQLNTFTSTSGGGEKSMTKEGRNKNISFEQYKKMNESKKEADEMIEHLFTPSTALLFSQKKQKLNSDRKKKPKKIRGYSFERNIKMTEDF